MPTYDAIATTTLATATSSINFSSISQSYTDLFIAYKVKMATGGGTNTRLQFNGDSATNYGGNSVYYTIGGARGYQGYSNGSSFWLDNVDSTWTTVTQIDINNYKSTNMKKSILVQAAAPASQVDIKVGTWNSTAAITSINIFNVSGVNFAVGSQFTIYGILAA